MNRKTTILVVDDDESIRDSIKDILEYKGYQVDTAKSGKEAIENSRIKSYNLALIDIRLPDMEGTELLTAMRETIPRMIKIIVTGFPSTNNAIQAVNENADAYLVKPVDARILLETIEKYLKKQEEELGFSEDKLTSFIKGRVKEWEIKQTRSS